MRAFAFDGALFHDRDQTGDAPSLLRRGQGQQPVGSLLQPELHGSVADGGLARPPVLVLQADGIIAVLAHGFDAVPARGGNADIVLRAGKRFDGLPVVDARLQGSALDQGVAEGGQAQATRGEIIGGHGHLVPSGQQVFDEQGVASDPVGRGRPGEMQEPIVQGEPGAQAAGGFDAVETGLGHFQGNRAGCRCDPNPGTPSCPRTPGGISESHRAFHPGKPARPRKAGAPVSPISTP